MAYSSKRPDAVPGLVPGPSDADEYEVPVVTAALSRRELRQRSEASSIDPAVETRRERRDRELAASSAVASAASELGGASAASVPVGRRALRDTSGLEHLIAPRMTTPKARVADAATAVEAQPTVPATTAAFARPAAAATPAAASATPAAAASPRPAAATPAAAASATPAAAASPRPAAATPAAAASATPAAAATPAPADHFTAGDLPSPTATTVRSITFSHADESQPRAVAPAPRGARTSVSASTPRRRVLPAMRRTASGAPTKKRTIVNSIVMVATAGLVATIALPAYAYDESDGGPRITASNELGIQSLTVSGVNSQASERDGYTSTGDVAAMDSTTGTTVSPTVQALAAELVADVAAGKLVGSVPDHIVEIRNLANGIAVPGCGVDYRVLQTIKVAVDNFDKVGVSDINRRCTNQIEGAGTASSHYKDGGGHAVDFYILNGHGLTGADSDSIKLIQLLDPMVPPGSGLGQASCGRSISVTNFAPFDDTCTHLHVDFGAARGVSLSN